MENKRNYKYFAQRGLSPLSIVGLVLIALGIVALFEIKDLGTLLIIGGVACLVLATSGRAKESDINYQVSEKTKDLEERAMIRYEVYEKDFLKIVNPAKLHGYDYISEGVYFKHGADGKNRTSKYNGIQIFYTDKKLYVHGRRFSLIDESDDVEFGGVWKYTDLDRADYEEREMALPKNRKATYQVFKIIDNSGATVLEISVSYGADVDKVIEDINHVIALKKRDGAIN
ncbi:MAG: hypothetical protein IKN38_05050 [Clostridia bacterium]|nr:hypothetical protein [Clostridia bacterium]